MCKDHNGMEHASRLLTQADIANDVGPPWLRRVQAEFRRHVLDPGYPCYFAVAGERSGQLRYSYVEDLAGGIDTQAMLEFLELSATAPTVRHALAVFVKPEPTVRSHDYYRRLGWDLLQKLHDKDPAAWPGDVPKDPADPKWEFSFGSEPMFVFGAMPSHQLRRSRNLGPSMILLFQPRRVFAEIEGGTPAGKKAREVIRERLDRWDLIGLHPSMGDYGDPSNFEYKQYFISDNDEDDPGSCPLNVRGVVGGNGLGLSLTRITRGEPEALGVVVAELLPRSRSIEVQNDPPGRTHPLHSHPVDEVLYVWEGQITFYIDGNGHVALPGTRIELPAGTPHSSTAGPSGCKYLIAVRP